MKNKAMSQTKTNSSAQALPPRRLVIPQLGEPQSWCYSYHASSSNSNSSSSSSSGGGGGGGGSSSIIVILFLLLTTLNCKIMYQKASLLVRYSSTHNLTSALDGHELLTQH
jgi:hypothetical protein